MTCTDEDVKRLKKRVADDRIIAENNFHPTDEIDSLSALLARLEAAEERASYLSMFAINDPKADEYERAWRKECGK